VNWFNDVLTALLDAVQSVDPVLRTLLAGVGIFLETSVLVGLIVPGDTIVIVAATAVDSPVEYAALVAVVILGALGGESVGFALGRFFGPKIRHSRLVDGSVSTTGVVPRTTSTGGAASRCSCRASCPCCTRSCRSPWA